MKAIVFGVALILSGCNFNWGCALQTTLSGAVSNAVSTALQCQNKGQVLSDITALVSKTGVCAPQGVIGNIVCPQLSGLIISQLGNQIPASWQCNPMPAEQSLAAMASAACSTIPF